MLFDEPLVPDSQVSDYSDDEAEPLRPRRDDGNGSTFRPPIVNRLASFRTESQGGDDETQASGPMAFHTSVSVSAFKIPALLRRSTTAASNGSVNGGVTTTTAGGGNENAVRRGGNKKSNIHFQAREAERMKKVVAAEGKRREGIRKRVGRGRVSVLGAGLESQGSGFE